MASRYTSNCALGFQLLLLAPLVYGLVNVTVDDAGIDQSTGLGVSYSPLADWNARTATSDCEECVVNLDPSQLYMGTWHDATYDGPNGPRTQVQSATFGFNGKARFLSAHPSTLNRS